MPGVVYVVSGLPRSGTSMMMHALTVGGMESVYDKRLQQVTLEAVSDTGRRLHAFGVYETTGVRFSDEDAISRLAGKLVKVFFQPVSLVVADGYELKVVFMVRDCREVAASIAEMTRGTQFQRTPDPAALSAERDCVIRELRDTSRVGLIEVELAETVAAPVDTLQRVVDFLGVDVDVDFAAAVVDPSLVHNVAWG